MRFAESMHSAPRSPERTNLCMFSTVKSEFFRGILCFRAILEFFSSESPDFALSDPPPAH